MDLVLMHRGGGRIPSISEICSMILFSDPYGHPAPFIWRMFRHVATMNGTLITTSVNASGSDVGSPRASSQRGECRTCCRAS